MRLCRHLKQPPPPVSVSLLLNSVINEASPELTLVIWVHGSICFASKVLWEFTWIWHCADDPESRRTVRICHNALMWALRCLDRAPYLWEEQRWQKGWVIFLPNPSELFKQLLGIICFGANYNRYIWEATTRQAQKVWFASHFDFFEWFSVLQTSMYFPTIIFYSSRASVWFKCSFHFWAAYLDRLEDQNLSNQTCPRHHPSYSSVYYIVLHYKAYNRSCCLPTAMVLHTIKICDIPAFLEPVRKTNKNKCGKLVYPLSVVNATLRTKPRW